MSHNVQGTARPERQLAISQCVKPLPLAGTDFTLGSWSLDARIRIYHWVDWSYSPVCLCGVSRGYFYTLELGLREVKRWVRDREIVIPTPILVLALIQGDEAWVL